MSRFEKYFEKIQKTNTFKLSRLAKRISKYRLYDSNKSEKITYKSGLNDRTIDNCESRNDHTYCKYMMQNIIELIY